MKKNYEGGEEPARAFQMRAMTVVRLFLEEAFHRCMMSAKEDKMRMKALSSMMVTFHLVEGDTMGDFAGEALLFSTMGQVNVGRIGESVMAGVMMSQSLLQLPKAQYFESTPQSCFNMLILKTY